MEIKAVAKTLKISPRKLRLVADALRGMSIVSVISALSLTPKRGAPMLLKAFKSAIANAVNNNHLNESKLIVKSIEITEGTAMKRFHPSTRGRVHPYKKRTSHLTIVLTEAVVNGEKSSNEKQKKEEVTK